MIDYSCARGGVLLFFNRLSLIFPTTTRLFLQLLTTILLLLICCSHVDVIVITIDIELLMIEPTSEVLGASETCG